MPFIKKAAPEAVLENGTGTQNSALQAEIAKAVTKLAVPKGRDFDAEARGKTRCALEEAWAQSPLLPMLLQDPSDRAALHAMLDEIVTERMKRVFPNG